MKRVFHPPHKDHRLVFKNRKLRDPASLHTLLPKAEYAKNAETHRVMHERENILLGIGDIGVPRPPNETPIQTFLRRSEVNIDSSYRDTGVYPAANSYTLDLGRRYQNVIGVKMLSSEIPISERLILDTPLDRANNKIYWQNQGADDIYVAEFPAGNYDATTLQSAIEVAMNNVRNAVTNAFHEFTVTVDAVSNLTTFSSLVTEQLSNPFETTAGLSLITVNHEAHGFSNGDLITIYGAVRFNGIEPVYINKQHVVIHDGIDPDSYTIDIGEPAIITTPPGVGGGGDLVRVGVGLPFKLLWSAGDTPAIILGFDEVDTGFNTVHQNTTIDRIFGIESVRRIDSTFSAVLLDEAPSPALAANQQVYLSGVSGSSNDDGLNNSAGYSMDLVSGADAVLLGLTAEEQTRVVKIPVAVDAAPIGTGGTLNTRTLNRAVNLAGESYIFIQCPQLPNMDTVGTVDNVFAKIALSGSPGTQVFDSYIGGNKRFETPLRVLDQLTFSFVTRDGTLYDFLDFENSFTLLITEQIIETNGSGVSGYLGTLPPSVGGR
jgi:hypothetical protein